MDSDKPEEIGDNVGVIRFHVSTMSMAQAGGRGLTAHIERGRDPRGLVLTVSG
jgi:hypothetical protein